MENHTTPTADPLDSRRDFSPPAGVPGQDALQERIRRLEDAIAALQDTRSLEERVLNRVTENVLPRAAETSFRRLDGDRRPTPQPVIEHAPLAPLPPLKTMTPVAFRSGWSLFELVGEIRTFVRMFFDFRYRVTWFTWLVTVIGLSFALLSHWVMPFIIIPILGPILDKVVDVFVVLFIYKVLSLEAQRYRETLAAYQQAYPH
jgi:hypothetical protein